MGPKRGTVLLLALAWAALLAVTFLPGYVGSSGDGAEPTATAVEEPLVAETGAPVPDVATDLLLAGSLPFLLVLVWWA